MVMHQIGINLPGWRGHRLPSSPPQCLVDTSSQPVGELLVRWKAEDREALEKLVPLVYKELREIARCHLPAGTAPGHALQIRRPGSRSLSSIGRSGTL